MAQFGFYFNLKVEVNVSCIIDRSNLLMRCVHLQFSFMLRMFDKKKMDKLYFDIYLSSEIRCFKQVQVIEISARYNLILKFANFRR